LPQSLILSLTLTLTLTLTLILTLTLTLTLARYDSAFSRDDNLMEVKPAAAGAEERQAAAA